MKRKINASSFRDKFLDDVGKPTVAKSIYAMSQVFLRFK